jgi:hypothetical protein
VGLSSEELNGREGVCGILDDVPGRYAVRLDGDSADVNVKPQNLEAAGSSYDKTIRLWDVDDEVLVLLMSAHLTVLGALHLFIFTTSFFPTTLPTHPPDSPLAPPNNDETQALSAAMAAVVIGWWRVVMDVLWWGTREGLLMMCVALVLSALDSVGQAAQVDITSFLFKVSNINVKIFYLKDVTPIGFRV